MKRQPEVYLEIARAALIKVQSFLGDATEQSYLTDDFRQSAVERQLEIAGDALGQVRKIDEALFMRIPDGHVVVAFRNVLAHGYASLDHRIVYAAARNRAPQLLRVLEELISEYPDEGL